MAYYDAAISFPFLGENFILNPPRYFEIGNFKIYLYGVLIALGFILAAVYFFNRCKIFGLTRDNVIDMFLCAIPSGIIGARLYYIIFNFEIFKADTFGEMLKNCINIRNGGLAIYGGLILGIIVLFFYARAKKIKFGAILDLASPGVIIGQIVGRFGNFINREAYGVSDNINEFIFRMGFTTADGATTYVHPTFLYEAVWNLIGFLILHFVSKKRKFDGQIFVMYVAWYGLGRFFIEGLRADSLYFFETSLRVSQGLAAISFIAAIMYLILRLSDKRSLSPDKLYVNIAAASNVAAVEKNETEEPVIENLSDEPCTEAKDTEPSEETSIQE